MSFFNKLVRKLDQLAEKADNFVENKIIPATKSIERKVRYATGGPVARSTKCWRKLDGSKKDVFDKNKKMSQQDLENFHSIKSFGTVDVTRELDDCINNFIALGLEVKDRSQAEVKENTAHKLVVSKNQESKSSTNNRVCETKLANKQSTDIILTLQDHFIELQDDVSETVKLCSNVMYAAQPKQLYGKGLYAAFILNNFDINNDKIEILNKEQSNFYLEKGKFTHSKCNIDDLSAISICLGGIAPKNSIVFTGFDQDSSSNLLGKIEVYDDNQGTCLANN